MSNYLLINKLMLINKFVKNTDKGLKSIRIIYCNIDLLIFVFRKTTYLRFLLKIQNRCIFCTFDRKRKTFENPIFSDLLYPIKL